MLSSRKEPAGCSICLEGESALEGYAADGEGCALQKALQTSTLYEGSKRGARTPRRQGIGLLLYANHVQRLTAHDCHRPTDTPCRDGMSTLYLERLYKTVLGSVEHLQRSL